jgi:predicted kinase
MRTILMTIGLPGCGKTIYACKLLAREPGRWKRINRDDLRQMNDNHLFQEGQQEREAFITREVEALVWEALRSEFDVILDNTHLSSSSRKGIHQLAERCGNVQIQERVLAVPLEQILWQNEQRSGERRVPPEVICQKAAQYGLGCDGTFRNIQDRDTYYPPVQDTAPLIQDSLLPAAVICDLDGTLSLIGKRNPYDASTCEMDEVNQPVAILLGAMAAQGTQVLFVSGRQEKDREPTLRFLRTKIPGVCWQQLWMRATGDQRKDAMVKQEIFDQYIRDQYYVHFVVDDRPQVVRMWRGLGLTVLQVNDREF